MKYLQKIGGVSALIIPTTFIVGLVLNFTFLDSSGIDDPVQMVEFLRDTQAIMYVWIMFIYVIFGIFVVFLALALYEQLKTSSPALAQPGAVFGIIWAVHCKRPGL